MPEPPAKLRQSCLSRPRLPIISVYGPSFAFCLLFVAHILRLAFKSETYQA